MHRTRIKICGITRPEDAAVAARLGADAIGIVLHAESKRGVSPDAARKIIDALPPFVSPVAVFVNEDPQAILDLAARLNVRHVQLNGNESPHEIAEMPGLSVLKAIRVERGKLANSLAKWRHAIAELNLSHLAAFVLETASAKAGGSGIENDWPAIREVQSTGGLEGLPSVIAAGGLRPDNVAQVVRELRPFAVDVSSGVEVAIGQKSEEKLKAFIDAVRGADRS